MDCSRLFLVPGKFVLCGVLLLAVFAQAQAQSLSTQSSFPQPTHQVSIEGDHFVLDGKPLQIISGEIHYAAFRMSIGGTVSKKRGPWV